MLSTKIKTSQPVLGKKEREKGGKCVYGAA